jgi:hypothetical protein
MRPYLLVLSFVALASFTPAIVAAGEIRGTLTKDGKPVTDAAIEITAAGNKAYSAKTDQYGSYQVLVLEKGKCNITVASGQQHCSLAVDSFDASVRYDLILEIAANGSCALRIR